MMLLTDKLKNFAEKIAEIEDVNIYHYFRPMMSAPFILWAETGENNNFSADNHKDEQIVGIDIDYYTKAEFDGVTDDIQEILQEIECAWTLSSVAYEDDTELIHYSWSIEI